MDCIKAAIFKSLRFITAISMTYAKKQPCHFDPAFAGEKSPENVGCTRGISLPGNDSNAHHAFSGASIDIKGFQAIFLFILIVFVNPIESSAQNIMKINSVQGLVNDTLVVPLAITNSEEFISFQCDILMPDGFKYLPGSVSLSPRSVDHVVNVMNIGNNELRILSYSLNNSVFLSDSGIVATLLFLTPPTAGDYVVKLNNGIIGNAESVNILDSLIPGNITLNPLGVLENSFSDVNIQCFPNPFSQNLVVQVKVDGPQFVVLEVFNIKGVLMSRRRLNLNHTGINEFVFQAQDLLGNRPTDGIYLLNFILQKDNHKCSIVKRIHFQQ